MDQELDTAEEQPFNFEGIDDNFPDSSDHADNEGVSASDENRLAFLDLGVMFREKKNYKKALYYYKQCIEENLSEHGIYHEQVAIAYNDIGLIYNEKGLDEEALELYKKVLCIGLKVHGEKHENVVIYYANVGEWYFEHKGYKEALHFHEKSLGVKLAIYPNDHQEVGFSFDKIGHCWQFMGNHSKALEFHRKCLEINIKHNGTSHEYVAVGQFNIGECLMDSGQYKEATESLKKAYAIEKLGGYAFKIAECYEALQDRNNALDYYIKSAEVRKDSLGQDHEKTIKAVGKAKQIYKVLGQFNIDLPAWFDNVGNDLDLVMEAQTNTEKLTFASIAKIISESMYEALKNRCDDITEEIIYNVFIKALTSNGNSMWFNCAGISTKNIYDKISWYNKDIDEIISKMKLNEVRYLIIENVDMNPLSELHCSFFHEDCKYREMYWRYQTSGDELYEKIMALNPIEPGGNENIGVSTDPNTSNEWIEKYIIQKSHVRDILIDEWEGIEQLSTEDEFDWNFGTSVLGCVDLVEKKFFIINALGLTMSVDEYGGIGFHKEVVEKRLASED